jgi:hypothetical protein
MDELETLLRQFRPRRPGPLPDDERGRGVRPVVRVGLAGLAAAVALIVGWRQPVHDSDAPKTAVTLGALTPYVIDQSRDLERSNGVLHALAKE